MTLTGIYLSTVALSTAVTLLNNKSARDTINRKGYIVDDSETTLSEKFNYFLSDYFFLCLPIYNLYKSIIVNRIKKRPAIYAQERFSTLDERGLLKSKEDIKKEREARKVKEVAKPKEEEKKVEPQKRVVKEHSVQAPLPERRTPVVHERTFTSKQEELEYYKTEFSRLKNVYNKARESGQPFEVQTSLYNKLIELKSNINRARQELIDELKAEREVVEAASRKGKKLELK